MTLQYLTLSIIKLAPSVTSKLETLHQPQITKKENLLVD